MKCFLITTGVSDDDSHRIGAALCQNVNAGHSAGAEAFHHWTVLQAGVVRRRSHVSSWSQTRSHLLTALELSHTHKNLITPTSTTNRSRKQFFPTASRPQLFSYPLLLLLLLLLLLACG